MASKVKYFHFVGGPDDGLVLENGIGFVPDVIDNGAVHLFGDRAYAVTQIDFDNGNAVFEHMRLVNENNGTKYSEDSGV